ncbi:MAG: excinuclease ABC subunit UvrA [Deltaproteobacteria bacterium]|nr:excinuclease ABC subunit UvrA [Deltaproteobacteria bacterium]
MGSETKKEEELIVIRGARQNNLKNIDVDIPRNALTVITGLSGSGKSSLAFDTIYSEGRRRYVESLSAYARQFLGQLDKPDLDLIVGLSPAIAIEQKTASSNPRSTAGTVTEIYDYLRLFFAKVGEPHCHKCGRSIQSQSPQEIVDRLLSLDKGTKLMLLAPLMTDKKGEHQKLFDSLRKDGFTRIRVSGELFELSEPINLEKNKKNDIDVVVDRIIIKEDLSRRMTDSVELALRLSGGTLIAAILDDDLKSKQELLFSQHYACDHCGISFSELTPQLFSFNSHQGACPDCGGLGSKYIFAQELIVEKYAPIFEGGILPWGEHHVGFSPQEVHCLYDHFGWEIYSNMVDLPKGALDVILNGTGTKEIKFVYEIGSEKHHYSAPFDGVYKELYKLLPASQDENRHYLDKYRKIQTCPSCRGRRLKPEALAVTVGGADIYSLCSLTIAKCLDWFIHIDLGARDMEISRRIIKEIRDRLGFLNDVGLGYLTLNRSSSSLSGGESQRIRLATQIGAKLVGVMYVLDEPSIGLHQRDNERLLNSLKKMRDLGNTVIVVEHDAETILRADHVIDMGPGAGENGGKIMFEGPPDKLLKDSNSLTGQYLSGEKIVGVNQRRKKAKGFITLTGAKVNNLKNITVRFPIGALTVVTGVSGSGKSSLVLDALQNACKTISYSSSEKPVGYDSVSGLESFKKVIDIDQSPIGRTPRSNPATYIGVFNHIRTLFASTQQARARGYNAGRFSFNVAGGRCPKCQGDGIIKIEMHFLPDVYIRCENCKGKRYNRDTLEIKYAGATIADVLDMTVSQAVSFFDNLAYLKQPLLTLQDVGLGYIRLGQSATSLSGGEAQRVKLSKELARKSTGQTIYILDEPTTGLHFEDVKQLLSVLQRLVSQGNTIIVIEHNLDIIKNADHIIDLGPEGGDGGGRLVAEGTPEQVAAVAKSHTGRFLKKALNLK